MEKLLRLTFLLILTLSLLVTAMPALAQSPVDLVGERTENSKTFDMGDGSRQLVASMGPIHYKDNYADSGEAWKDIDLTWTDNKITKAPYDLTIEGKKITILDKKSGEISTIELLSIGDKSIPDKAWEKSKGLAKAPGIVNLDNIALDTDLEITAENGRVSFTRVLKSAKAPKDAKFKVTGNCIVRARDSDGELPVESSRIDGVLTETLAPDRDINYPCRIDPVWQVSASTDDCRIYYNGSAWVFSLTGDNVAAGYASGTVYRFNSGMRFTNVTIPRGSTIDSAYLTITAQGSLSGTTVNTKISAEDVDDAATFVDDGAAYLTRFGTHTTARVTWNSIGSWTLDAEYNSPSIETVIQEIIDRGGWGSGQDIVIFWEDDDNQATASRTGYSYDGSTDYCPQLVITYTAPTYYLIICIDGVEQGATLLPEGLQGIPDNASPWIFVENGSMLYLEEQTIEVGGVPVQAIEWEYTSGDFIDSTLNGNDATPSYRIASNNLNVTASLTGIAPVTQAKVSTFTLGELTDIFTTTPDAIPQMYSELDFTHIPLAPGINSILTVGEVPQALWWYPFLFGIICILALMFYGATTRRVYQGRITDNGDQGSILFMCIIVAVLLSFLGIMEVIPFWPAILIWIPMTAIMLSQKHHSVG